MLFPIARVGVTRTSLFQKHNYLWLGSVYRLFAFNIWTSYRYNNKKQKLHYLLKPPRYRRNRIMNIGNNSLAMSKKEKFMNLVKSTRDVYFPTISQTIRQSTSSVWDHSKNFSSSTLSNPSRELPSDMQIVFYPTYSTKKYNRYETRVRFSLQSPGNITSRKNRLLVMLSKQYLKSKPNINSNFNTTSAKKDNVLTSGSYVDDNESNNINNNNNNSPLEYNSSVFNNETEYFNPVDTDSNELKVLKERLKGFITKSFANVPLKITASNKGRSTVQQTISDAKGFVDTKILTDFPPKDIEISLDHG